VGLIDKLAYRAAIYNQGLHIEELLSAQDHGYMSALRDMGQ